MGVPDEDVGSERDAGMVTIIPGSPSGLDPAGSVGYTQDSPGFPGVVEEVDWFGLALAAGTTHHGEPFLLIGSPGESGPDWTTRASGYVHYLRGGTVTSFHQDTPGISGVAERGDAFGWSVSVLPFQPASGRPVGALVAVGSWEAVGDTDDAGMAHLVYASPAGGLDQWAAVHQSTPGVTGGPEEGDHLGYRVVVANLDPGSPVATPQTMAWAAGVPWEESGLSLVGAVHVFPPGWQVGEPDIWLKEGRFGLGNVSGSQLRASSSHLHAGSDLLAGPCYAVPWPNLLADAGQPVVTRAEPCAHRPGLR